MLASRSVVSVELFVAVSSGFNKPWVGTKVQVRVVIHVSHFFGVNERNET